MAAVGATVGTLADITQEGTKARAMVDLLSEVNSMSADAIFIPANNGNYHDVDVVTSLPKPYFRALNEPVLGSKGTTATIRQSAAKLESWLEMDIALIEARGGDAYRGKQYKLHMEAMNQQVQESVLYGNAALNPKQFTGLSVLYSDRSAANGNSIINGEGSGSKNTSMWYITWGDDDCYIFYPDGSDAGLAQRNFGTVAQGYGSTTFGKQKHMAVEKHQFKWDLGLGVADHRQVVRIANIDVPALQAGTGAELFVLAMRAETRVFDPARGKACWYANRTVIEELKIQANKRVSAGGGLTYDNVDGKAIMMLGGVPVRRCDRILNTEATIS